MVKENDNQTNNEQRETHHRQLTLLTLDDVVATQPELGPSIPDGGFGWAVFIGTLFFQALVPCLIVNLGIFLAFSKLENGTSDDKNIRLWDDKIVYVPLFFSIARNFFDNHARALSIKTTTPRLMSVVGTCLTCAGLLFVWMGMTGDIYWLYAPAGILSGLGATIVLIQCETLMAQYFRLKLPILNQISQCVGTLGFLIGPVILGRHILDHTLTHVLLWYQAIILQGLIISLVFRKPLYLKSRKPNKSYQSVLSSPDDEEDILSKNARELQIKRQTSTETEVKKIPIDQSQPGTSTSNGNHQKDWIKIENEEQPSSKQWETFTEERAEDIKYAKLNDWELFDDDEDEQNKKTHKWEHFEDDEPPSPRIINNLSFAEEMNTQPDNNPPSPLFSDFPVNNNNTYAYDDEIITETTNSNVFMPNSNENENFKRLRDLLKEPTFYKSLLMMVANTYSSFVFYSLYPSYLYIESNNTNIRQMTGLIGAFSLVNLVFLCVVYWIFIDKEKRAIWFCIFYWMGCVGYFMIADFREEHLLLVGGILTILSIGALEHISKPILGIPLRGGTSNENLLLTTLSSLSLFVFIFLDVSFKTCFRLVAVIHFFTGTLWIGNFAYKRLRTR